MSYNCSRTFKLTVLELHLFAFPGGNFLLNIRIICARISLHEFNIQTFSWQDFLLSVVHFFISSRATDDRNFLFLAFLNFPISYDFLSQDENRLKISSFLVYSFKSRDLDISFFLLLDVRDFIFRYLSIKWLLIERSSPLEGIISCRFFHVHGTCKFLIDPKHLTNDWCYKSVFRVPDTLIVRVELIKVRLVCGSFKPPRSTTSWASEWLNITLVNTIYIWIRKHSCNESQCQKNGTWFLWYFSSPRSLSPFFPPDQGKTIPD